MRTTVTLDPDVQRLLDEAQHRSKRPFKQVLNDAVRVGLGRRAAPAPAF
jgi:predicted transcriptional regulator